MPDMTPERWQRVTALLDRVLPCEADERGPLLDDLCAGDEELRREVDSLLSYEDECVSLLEEPIVPSPARPAPATNVETALGVAIAERDETGLRIGPYKVIERLGTGGMGDVFLAARQDDFRKKVALKRIQHRKLAEGDKVSEELRYRFETERQILADLEHPNIARILDGGTTRDGVPYFAMEYVEGLPIDEYCERRRLSVRERLELFLQVCSALQLAHQNLVVHRDLKPGNILVTADGVPKLLDFGIAKLLDPDASTSAATRFGGQPMTLRYAAPEQLQAAPVTTATDVYALGVLLYQILTGHDPYPFDQGTLRLHQAICRETPSRPSTAVGREVEVGKDRRRRTPESVSLARGTRPDRLRRQLAGDLDSIVLKALQKKPEERYRSVEQFARDIRRHLNGLPVSACEGTFRYLAGKFALRHKWRLVAAGALMAILVSSTVAMTSLRRQAAEERARTEQARALAGRTAELLGDVIEVIDPDETGNRVTPLEFLNRAQKEITEDLLAEPDLLAELLNDPLAKIYGRLGHDDEALASLNQALATMRLHHPSDHPTTAELLLNKGAFLYRSGDYDGAERLTLDALEMRQRLGMAGADLVAPLSNLATVRAREGNYDRAADLYRRALDIQRQLVDPKDPSLAIHLRNLGMLDFNRGRLESAKALLDQALHIDLSTQDPVDSRIASVRSALGRVLQAQGEIEEAEEQFVEALKLRRQLFDDGHHAIARAERNLAGLVLQLGDLATAELLLGRAQAVLRQKLEDEHWEIAELDGLIGAYLAEIGQYEAAEICLIESHRALEAARGAEAIYTKLAQERLVRLYELWEKPHRADDYRALLHARPE